MYSCYKKAYRRRHHLHQLIDPVDMHFWTRYFILPKPTGTAHDNPHMCLTGAGINPRKPSPTSAEVVIGSVI